MIRPRAGTPAPLFPRARRRPILKGISTMFRPSIRSPRAVTSVIAIALLSGALFVAPQARAWPAGSGGDVTIDDFSTTDKEGAKIAIKHIEFKNTNLEKEEIQKILTPDAPKDEKLALIQKLKADKVSIPTIEVTPKKGGLIHLNGFEADDIDEGKVAKMSFASIDGGGEENGAKVSIKSGALRLEDADLAEVLKATGSSPDSPVKGRLGHMTWEGVDVVAPDDKVPGKTIHLAFASFELKSDYDGDVVKQGSTMLKGFVLEPAPGSEFATQLSAFGYSKIELAAAIGAHYDATAKALSLENFTVEGVQMGSVGLKANFGDIEPALFTGGQDERMQALIGASIASLEIKLVNAGIFEKALAFYAKQQGTSPDALKQQVAAAATQMVPVLLGGNPDSLKVAAEAQKFINTPKNLTLSVKAKGDPLKAADFMGAAGDPTAILGKLDISAVANQ
jgi:hypothetical protein